MSEVADDEICEACGGPHGSHECTRCIEMFHILGDDECTGLCDNCAQERVIELEQAVGEVVGLFAGKNTDEPEHEIECHTDQLPDYYKDLCAAVEKAKTLLYATMPCNKEDDAI